MEDKLNSSILEELYAPKEISDAYDKGFNLGREFEHHSHKCRTKIVVKEKRVYMGAREHPRSRRRKFGVVSNGLLLNPTFDTEAEAAVFLRNLIPANPSARPYVKIEAQVVKLF